MLPSTSTAPSDAMHQHKRRFQPSITLYLSPSSTCSSPPSSTLTTTPSSLPSSIQSSLLQVGMRIRKSVPEGYKTKSHVTTTTKIPLGTKSWSSVNATRGSGRAELTPFCGLHKIGNLEVQELGMGAPIGEVEEEGDLLPLVFEELDEGFPGSSQESNFSTRAVESFNYYGARAPGPGVGNERGNKRIWEEDEDGEGVEGRRDVDISSEGIVGLRIIAQPKTRRKGFGAELGPTRKEGMQKGVEDFEEAEFLRVEEWMDLDF
ncbi:MAG: hypothetical protein MMC33_003340 [Icmadophila ericetorum]|nr:hypothetical protein [Icmadophila ericetorum]